MPYLIIPSRRTRQPQGFVRVNWSNQLTRGLRALWLPNFGGGGVREAVNGLFFPSSGSVSVTAGEYGVGLSLTAGSNYIDCGALASQVVTTQELSVMAIIRPAVLTRGDLITRWVQGASYGDQFDLLYGLSSGKPQFYVSNGGSTGISNSGASSIALTVGKTSVVGGTASMIESATRVYVDGQLGSSGGVPANISTTSATSYRIGDNIGGDGNYNGDFFGGAVWDRALPLAEWVELYRNPHQLFTPDPRRLYFDGGAGAGGGVVTESASGRLRARGSETSAPIRAEVVTARRKARAVATTTAVKVEAVVARRKARATDSTSAIRTESAVCRVKARSTTTVVHIDAGAIVQPVAGRRQVSASITATPIRTEAVVARRQARGSDTVTLTRTESVAARRKARGAVTAAPVVAGMITEAVAGRLRARGGATVTTTRIEVVSARRKARGSAVINGIRAALAAGRARLRTAVAGAPYVAPVTLSVDPRYLVPARGRHFTAYARGRRFVART